VPVSISSAYIIFFPPPFLPSERERERERESYVFYLTTLSVAGVGMKQEYKALVEQYLQEKTKLLGNKTSATLAQIPHALVWDRTRS